MCESEMIDEIDIQNADGYKKTIMESVSDLEFHIWGFCWEDEHFASTNIL
jgi:hypothetical protein